MNRDRSLVFYFPYRGIGGVSALFLRIAEVLKSDFLIYLADFSDGYMAKNLPDGVTLIAIDDNPQFPAESTFIFQSFLPWRFPFLSKVDPGSRVLFWGLHPQNFDPQIFNEHHPRPLVLRCAKVINRSAIWRRVKLARFVRHLQERHAIVFMGRENVEATEKYLKFPIQSPDYLPVPIPAVPVIKAIPEFPKILECAWIGRICDFKFRILEHIVYRLAKAAEIIGPIRLTIVGDGEFKSYLEEAAGHVATGRFSVEFRGEMPLSAVPCYLAEEVDILFAMGTSALEGARVGVPVFLADFSYEEISRIYCFRPLYDSIGLSLGEEITERHYEAASSLEASLQAVIEDYPSYSRAIYDYWRDNFEIGSAVSKLRQYLEGTTATFGEIERLSFFEADVLGRVLRSGMSLFRKDLNAPVVGFHHDR